MKIKSIFALFMFLLFAGWLSAQEGQESTEKATQTGNQWQEVNSNVHLTGYGFAGYSQKADDKNSGLFNLGFNPIFHYTYEDIAMLEAELEYEIDEDGNTKTALEYATVDIFLNDYMTLIAGRFISPVGFFIQNIHPAWINKLPNKPVGFGHGGAAPSSETGVQLRGGIPLGDMRLNYAVYAGNGPKMKNEKAAPTEEPDIDQEGIAGTDQDPSKSGGGRISFQIIPDLEIGGSFAMGKLHMLNGGSISGPERDLRIIGGDLNYVSSLLPGLRVRGEFIRTTVSAVPDDYYVPGKINLTAYYAEVSYRTQWDIEPVVRFSQFNSEKGVIEDNKLSPREVGTEKVEKTQIAVGINYYIRPSVIAKLAYANEKTDNHATVTKEDTVMAQLAFGF